MNMINNNIYSYSIKILLNKIFQDKFFWHNDSTAAMFTLSGVWMWLCQVEIPLQEMVWIACWANMAGDFEFLLICKVWHGDSITKPDYYHYYKIEKKMEIKLNHKIILILIR